MYDSISIRAGRKAIEILRDEGLNLNRVRVMAGASGSAKFLVLTGIDRVLAQLLKDRTLPLYLVGTSIGAFRMSAFCRKDPLLAIDILEKEYICQKYSDKPARDEINAETIRIMDAFIDEKGIEEILNHPFLKLSFLTDRCRGLLASESLPLQWAGLGLAAGANLIRRDLLGLFFQRALFHIKGGVPPFSAMNQFPIQCHDLTAINFRNALLASGSIPVVMAGVHDIPGVSGMYRDGGILDYHLDIPFLPKQDQENLALFPHFFDRITPGWFDKKLNRKPDPDNMAQVVLIAPSPEFVRTLPLGRIPDRKDFIVFRGRDADRMALWRKAAAMNRRMGEDFADAVLSGRIRHLVKPL